MSLKKSQLRVVIPNFNTNSAPILGSEISLDDDESHRIRSVLRKHEGDELTLINAADGQAFLTVISRIAPLVTLKVVREESITQARSAVEILACALLKGDHNEWLCEKACELGVGRIVLWQAEHSVVRLDGKSQENRLKRLEKIISSAARQSANFIAPSVELAADAEQVTRILAQSNSAQAIFCSLAPDAAELQDVIDKKKNIQVIIGPEGDLSEQEERIFRQAAMQPVTLGPLVLRSETAAIAAVVAVNTVCGFRQ